MKLFDDSQRFIAQMKLRELKRQRASLRAAYDDVAEAAHAASSHRMALQVLHQGLRSITLAGRPLHEEVVHVEGLLRSIGQDNGGLDEVVDLWRRRLEDELAQGRRRAEFAYVFGALLEAWAALAGEAAAVAPPMSGDAFEALHERWLALSTTPTPPLATLVRAESLDIDTLLEGLLNPRACASTIRKRFETFVDETLSRPPAMDELELVLLRLARDIYRRPALRAEAQRFGQDQSLRKEFIEALAILWDEVLVWEWPSPGLTTRLVWTRNRWRLFLDEDLPTACMIELIGERWSRFMSDLLGQTLADRALRLRRLTTLHAPNVITDNERRLFQDAIALGAPVHAIVHWDHAAEDPITTASIFTALGDGESIATQRLERLWTLRKSVLLDESYSVDYGGEAALAKALAFVHAEVQLARSTAPERPLFVIKTDLENFYPSVPHALLWQVLGHLGLGADAQALLQRLLQVKLQDGRTIQRGVPLGHAISRLIGDLVIRLLETFVLKHANVGFIALVDDITLLATSADEAVAAWQAVQRFCAATGLAVRHDKSGAICIGPGQLPEVLPQARPRWTLLELDAQGTWRLHEPTFQQHVQQSRQRIAATDSLLTRIARYNADLSYLARWLVPEAALGDIHRSLVLDTLQRFQDIAVCGYEGGMIDMVRGEIATHTLENSPPSAIPVGWLFWPITAGGLGLTHAATLALPTALAWQQRTIPHPPMPWHADEARTRGPWAEFYRSLLTPLDPVVPETTRSMQALIDDFIERGTEVQHRTQKELQPYWRWIVVTFGPQLLEFFGSFRFLLTELVPLQLIVQHRMRDTTLDDDT